MRLTVLLILVCLICFPYHVRGATSACGLDALKAVISQGHSFVCDEVATVELPAPLEVTRAVSLDGQHRLTLTGREGTFIIRPGGTLSLSNLTIQNSRAIVNDGGTLVLQNVNFQGNTGAFGGAIFNRRGILSVSSGNFIRNIARNDGGAIANLGGTVTLNGASFVENRSEGSGGALINAAGNRDAVLNVINSTFSSNRTDGTGGAVYTVAQQGYSATTTITFSTLTQNVAALGGGLGNFGGTGDEMTTIQYTIVAANTARIEADDCWNGIVSEGYNIVGKEGKANGCPKRYSDTILKNGVDTVLSLLLDQDTPNGALVHPIHGGSPATDMVPLADCRVALDQRGVARPQGKACDIGAYEYIPPAPPVPTLPEGQVILFKFWPR